MFNLDLVHRHDKEAHTHNYLARLLCRIMLRQRSYLLLKPSQVAAASLMLAINLIAYDLAESFGVQRKPDSNL